MKLTNRDFLVLILAEADQQIAMIEDPSQELGDSNQAQRAAAHVSRLWELRTNLECRLRADRRLTSARQRKTTTGLNR